MKLTSLKPGSLRSKILLAGSVLVIVVIAMASLLYVSASRYEYHLQRNTVANQVLSGFQSISDHAYRKLNAMGQIGSQGEVGNVAARIENEQRLWDALATTRTSLNDGFALDPNSNRTEKLARLAQIESIVEEIIAGGSTIRDAVSRGETYIIQTALANLRSDEIAGQFNRLIDDAILEERAVVEASNAAARELSRFIDSALPGAILLTLMVGLLATVTISRSLTRSLDGLKHAADAYTSGNLDHRTELYPDAEFTRLGSAFNRMAEELSARRAEAERSQESLEQEVATRTSELAQAFEQLEQADGKRRQFLADISHELRTPLTLIQGEADMALRGEEKSPPEYREAITRVREQAVHTATLVKDLLLVARAEEGNVRLETRQVDLLRLIEEVNEDFRNAAARHDLTINQCFKIDAITLMGDPARLRQVFAILIDNAIRYSDEKSRINVDVEVRDLTAFITVSNQGITLTDQEVTQAFDRFFRSGSAAQRAEGSGLGLPVAKAIVEAHRGKISLCTEGERTKAQVQLPVSNTTETIA